MIDQQTVHALATLNDQLSIVGQVLMGQLAPALLSAGKAAIELFGRLKGAAALSMFANPINLGRLLGGDPEMRGAYKAGMKEYKDVQESTAKLLAAISNYTGQPLPAISLGGSASRGASRAAKVVPSDSLLSVGNFLGSARSKLETLAERQIGLLQTIARNTTPTPNSGGSGFPI